MLLDPTPLDAVRLAGQLTLRCVLRGRPLRGVGALFAAAMHLLMRLVLGMTTVCYAIDLVRACCGWTVTCTR